MAVTDLFMFRGDDRTFAMTATAGGVALNIAGASIVFSATREVGTAAVITKSTAGGGVTITDGAAGEFSVTIAAADTSGFTDDESLKWDVEITIGGTTRTLPEDSSGRPTYGTLKVKRDVST